MEATAFASTSPSSGDPERKGTGRRSRKPRGRCPRSRLVWSSTWPHQTLGRAAVRHLGHERKKSRKDKNGWSPTRPVLEKLEADHPVGCRCAVAPHLEQSSKGTYCDCAAKPWWSQNRRVHTEFQPAVDRHRRLSSRPSKPARTSHPHTQSAAASQSASLPRQGWQLISAELRPRSSAHPHPPLRRRGVLEGPTPRATTLHALTTAALATQTKPR